MKRTLQAIALAAICLLPFAPGLEGPFLHDDFANLERIAIGPASLDGALEVATSNTSGPLRRPVANLSLAANYWMHGAASSFGFKLVNLLLHGIAGVLVYFLCRSWSKLFRLPISDRATHAAALVAMTIWLLHPLQVSTALYVVQRMTQLSAIFLMAALLPVTHWLEKEDFRWPPTLRTAAAFLAFTLLAVGSKENGALAPLLCGIMIFVWHRRQPSATTIEAPLRAFLWAMVIAPLLMGAAIIASNPELTLSGYTFRDFTATERLLTQPVAILFYLKLFLFPNLGLMGLYHDDFPLFGPASVLAWSAVLAIIFVAGMAAIAARRHPTASFAALWFLAGHVLESSFLPLELVYEHRNYLPLVAVCWGVALTGLAVAERLPTMPRIAWSAPLLVLAALTFQRSVDWSSAQLFYTSELRRHQNSLRARVGEAYRLQETSASDAERERAEQRILEQAPNLIWPRLVAAAQQCNNPARQVDWAGIRAMLLGTGDDNRLPVYVQLITDRIVRGNCPHVERKEFADIVALAYRRALAHDKADDASRYARYLGWIHHAFGDWDLASQWMQSSFDATPDNAEPLFELAYLYLNGDRAQSAVEVAESIQRLAISHRPEVKAQLEELMGFTRHALANPAAEPLPSPAGSELP